MQNLKRWWGEMMARPGYEDILDKPLDPSAPTVMRDITESPGVREFLGPDGQPFAFKLGHYIFSLNMDGFNPYHGKSAGKHVTVGGVYMVCLNFPPSMRYDMENMFLVCIIPGPSEPSLDQINHILRPLVDVLIEFWDPGVHYASTPNFPDGRTVRIALIPLVCDLPAARQMSGFASISCTNFCAYCHQKLDDMDDINPSSWKSRTSSECRKAAMKWLAAQTNEDRIAEFKKSGIRYSELLRLPYWDPLQFTLVDPMHALLLGNLQRHCRHVWGMDAQASDGDGSAPESKAPKAEPTEEELRAGSDTLRHGTAEKLASLKVPVLQHLCREAQTMPEKLKRQRRKKYLVANLLEYVRSTYHP